MKPIVRLAGALLRRLPRRKPKRMSITDSIIRLTTRKREVVGLALGKSSRTRANRGLSRTPQTSTHSRPGGLDLSLSLRPIRSMTPKRTATFIALTAGTINGTSTRQVQASGVAFLSTVGTLLRSEILRGSAKNGRASNQRTTDCLSRPKRNSRRRQGNQ